MSCPLGVPWGRVVRPGPHGPAQLARALPVVLALAVLLAGCGAGVDAGSGSGDATEPAGGSNGRGTLTVITTTTVFADLVRAVGGDRLSARSIVPAGVGPEDFEPKPDDVRTLAGADLIMSNGVGLDDFLDDLLRSGNDGGTPRLVLGAGIPTIQVDGEPNPHFWLDPSLVRRYYLPAIRAKLSQVDPAGAPTYAVNAERYAGELEQLDTELQAQVATLPAASRRLVTMHDAFPYLARHFGFELVGVVVANVGQEPTAAQLSELVGRVRAAGVRAVFAEAQSSPRLIQTLAEETGVHVVTTLYNDALGPAPADTYLGLLRYDIDQIVRALS